MVDVQIGIGAGGYITELGSARSSWDELDNFLPLNQNKAIHQAYYQDLSFIYINLIRVLAYNGSVIIIIIINT